MKEPKKLKYGSFHFKSLVSDVNGSRNHRKNVKSKIEMITYNMKLKGL